jgi:hemerythrin
MEAQMELFTWYSKYSVNDEELDEHHKALFDIFNRLYDNCFDRNTANCLGPIIEELKSYSNYHFLAEEKHMKETGFQEIDIHINKHRDFTIKTLQLQQLAGNNEPEAIDSVNKYSNLLSFVIYSEHENYRCPQA